ncbi:isochorismatase [Rhizobium sp. AC44/96]|uniref:isochorismatase family protein n=1 Tax=unclassified Rhizobium TaxID=2613769 RepID=UPI00080F9BEB|nr:MULTISPECIES: isochorismatase family protein [unclassified Rhizobium]MDM9622895.1 isochorismatase family protein [Rhizobium sp. S96]OCJ13210.1 isochorismatase [Rhizobium sp. AC44/96]
MTEATISLFTPITSQPYAWPFDGRWSAGDTALLLLGFQRAPVAELAAETELAAASELLNTASTLGITIVAVRRGYGPQESPLAARRRALGDTIPKRGSAEWRFDERLPLPTDAIIVDISGDNAFFSTGLEEELRRRGVRNLLLTGFPTEGLVHATQRAANDMGFECMAVADACKGTSSQRHSAQLRITTFGNGLFGTVANSADIHSALKNL